MSNLDIYRKLAAVPKEAKKEIAAGRLKGMTDINPMWRIKMLTESFGMCGVGWYVDKLKEWTEVGADGAVCAFCDIALYVKSGDEWSKPIFGTGGSMLVAKEKNGLYTSDEAFKMAYTDAISVACKALGMGADVYWQGDRTKYSANTQKPAEKSEKQDLSGLREALAKAGFDEAWVCEQYKIKSLEELNAKQVEKLMERCDNAG